MSSLASTLYLQVGLCTSYVKTGLFSDIGELHKSSLGELNRLLSSDQIQTRISFWGTRIVEWKGDPQSTLNTPALSLEDLSGRVSRVNVSLPAEKQNGSTPPIIQEQIEAGSDLSAKMKNFYQLTDIQLQNSSLLTRLFNVIQDFFYGSYRQEFLSRSTWGLNNCS